MHQSLVAYNAGMLLASLIMMMCLVWHVHMLIALLKPDSQYDAGTAGVMSVMGKYFNQSNHIPDVSFLTV